MFRKFKENTVRISKPKPFMLHGVVIAKQPVGRYFEVMDRTGGIMMELLDAAFPGQTPKQVLESLTNFTTSDLRTTLTRVAGVLPRKFVEILREIVGATDNSAWDELTPTEMTEVVKKFWEVNDLSSFFKNAQEAIQRMTPKKVEDTGFKD